jgi:hypothetical protein
MATATSQEDRASTSLGLLYTASVSFSWTPPPRRVSTRLPQAARTRRNFPGKLTLPANLCPFSWCRECEGFDGEA